MRKRRHPLPTRAEAGSAIAEAIRASLSRHGISAAQAGLDIRPYGNLTDDRIDRIGIGCKLHQDAGARSGFEIVEPAKDAAWRESCALHIDELVNYIARLERRRDAFDPERTGATPPLWAWDIHPTAASILSLYRRIPALDGSHRIDGEHGRIVDLGDAPGVESAMIAYGDGIVRLVEARFPGGSTLSTEEGRVRLRTATALPDVIEGSLRGRSAGELGTQLGRGGRAGEARITAVRRTDGGLEITLRDVLFPWDARRRGDEDWRVRRMVNGKARRQI